MAKVRRRRTSSKCSDINLDYGISSGVWLIQNHRVRLVRLAHLLSPNKDSLLAQKEVVSEDCNARSQSSAVGESEQFGNVCSSDADSQYIFLLNY